MGNFLSLQTQLSFYSCFQLRFCFFHSICWTVALGKAFILCAKCIRQSSQIIAPIQLVNGLYFLLLYLRVVHLLFTSSASYWFGVFYNKCSMNIQRNLKGPTELGQKDKPVLAPVNGNDFSCWRLFPVSSLPLTDLSLKSMLRNT